MIWQSWWEQNCLHYLKWREPISWVTVKNTGETISVASEVQKKMIQEVFIPCLKEDKNAIARASAALALAKMEDQSSLATLKEALNQDKDFDVKRTVAFSLAMLQDKDTINEIIELTNNNQAKFSKFLDRPTALLILGYIKNPAVLESINGVFDPKKKSDTETQCAALLALANFKDKSYIPLISNILNDKSKDANIRVYAALALGFIKDPSALPELKKALDEKDNSIRSSAVMALGMIKSPDSKNDLINLLNKDKNAEVKAYTLLSLAQLRDASTYPTLSKISASKDYFLQGVSAISWGITGNEKILPELRELVEKKKRPMAYNAAIVAVGLLNDKKSVPILMKVLEKDKADQIAWAYAVQSLAMIGDNQITPALEKIFEEDQKKCSLTTEAYNNLLVALTVLGKRKEVLSVLTKQLEDKNLANDIKLNTLHGIGYIGDKSSIEPLINAYKQEKDNWVRMYAVQSLLLLLEKETINCYCCVIANYNFSINRLILDYMFAK